MQYVPVPSPTSSRFIDGAAPYPGFAAGANIAGLTAYAFLNRTWYAELGGYGTSRGAFSFMHAGLANDAVTKLEWHQPLLAPGLEPRVGPAQPDARHLRHDGADLRRSARTPPTRRRSHHTQDLVLDAQYQYLLDPHSMTAQFVMERSRHHYPDALANQPSAFVDAMGNPLPDSNSDDTTRPDARQVDLCVPGDVRRQLRPVPPHRLHQHRQPELGLQPGHAQPSPATPRRRRHRSAWAAT